MLHITNIYIYSYILQQCTVTRALAYFITHLAHSKWMELFIGMLKAQRNNITHRSSTRFTFVVEREYLISHRTLRQRFYFCAAMTVMLIHYSFICVFHWKTIISLCYFGFYCLYLWQRMVWFHVSVCLCSFTDHYFYIQFVSPSQKLWSIRFVHTVRARVISP